MASAQGRGRRGATTNAALLSRVLELVRSLAEELHPEMPGIDKLDATASLERDFGLDSLARAELSLRIEQAFGRALPDATIAEADAVADLARALEEVSVAPSQTAGFVAPAPTQAGAAARAVPSPATLLHALQWQASENPDRPYITLLDDAAMPERITFGALRAEALAVAAGLVARGVQPREAVALMLPTGREFFTAFFGALHAGAIPVPLYPPARPSQLESHLQRLAGILANCQARTLLTFEAARRVSHLLRAFNTELKQIATPAEVAHSADAFVAHDASSGDIAFLQYTSGSTGQPKGVMLTHANLLANLQSMQHATGVNATDRFVSWLPLYHDMGLIGACLGALVYGYELLLMSPLAFLARPVRWLQAISEHRATLTAAPNFAYEICLNKLQTPALEGIDLSSLRLAFNGAEAVSAQTLERFADRFAPHGLRREALMPVYGLAECALGLTFPPVGRGPLIDHIDRATFLRSGIAKPVPQPEELSVGVVSCGRVLPGHAIRIVDTDGTPLPDRRQGRIEFQGPSATSGYFRNPSQTAKLFDGTWLDTGDLGYLADGELYVTGRAKDIIIRGGHHIHPQELEEAVGRVTGVHKGGVVVFPALDRRQGTERVIVLAETSEENAAARAALIAQINRLAVDLIGMPVDEVRLAKPRTVLKTSSGKIRRAACREAYERGELGGATRAPWIQLARLALRGSAFEADARLDDEALRSTVRVAVRFLDDAIEISRYPLFRQREQARRTRRIGLGVTGLADALVMLGLGYDSEAAHAHAAQTLRMIRDVAYETSVELAKEKGSFPQLDREQYLCAPFVRTLPQETRAGIAAHGIRNSHLIAIAPAGSISLLAHNVSSGIEPIVGLETVRRVHGLDGQDLTFQVTDYAYAQWRARHTSQAELPSSFRLADRITPRDHLLMQAAIHPFVDAGISKTVTLAREASRASVDELFKTAYVLGLKGCTVFRSSVRPGVIAAQPDLEMLWTRAHRDRCSRAEAEGS